MITRVYSPITVTVLALSVSVAGCAAKRTTVADLERQLQQNEQRVASLETTVAQRDAQILQLSEARELPADTGGTLFPPAARPGECYARVFVPPQYNTETVEVLNRQSSERIEIIPARYEWVEEQVLVKEAADRIEVIPATYQWVEEQVLVKPATTRLEQIDPVYEWAEEEVLVKPAHTAWKKGRGPIEKVDHATGEILCLVEVPAQYKTVRKRMLKQPATTRTVEIPAQYKVVKKQVVKTPAQTRTVSIPAKYETVKVRKLAEPEREKRVEIPEKYETVTKRVKVSEGIVEWRPVLCETNATPGLVASIQRALLNAGHNPGPIDGRIGAQTSGALRAYQQAKGLPTGGVTMGTLESLGVSARR